MTTGQVVIAAVVLLLGAAVQGSVGFGLNLVAAPVLILVNVELVPVPLNMASLVFNLLIILREKGAHFLRQMRLPILTAIPGSVAGAAVVRAFTANGLSVVCGVVVLVAVAIILSGVHVERTRGTLGAAGVVSGFMGTAVSIGGPPIALLFSNATGPEIRGALSRFFLATNVIALVLLAGFGQVHSQDFGLAVLLVPGMVVGFTISSWLARHVSRSHIRFAVLGLSSVSAVLAIGKALV